ncbi:glutamate racemase [Flavihumibacter petaseus]|uniref:Glutamate racemase n=1 Tax=Flavihumibacter petaseus NBRC 106054 TaxID=1220578 RepID=A0A0E9N0F6_9BACT|nr:glutamate racemase [Flavihumibacter petaseus]GAO42850.1 glutamate racemase [Flavihumibacter petaseus NBRC 106054]
MATNCPIGIFDSGYGGLTVMKEIVKRLPDYDYIYLGDNARTPYGNRSFDTVYRYTLQAVQWFFERGCPLVVLACNTASAKALRTIQQNDLPRIAPDRRVLGVIRPTTEVVGEYSKSGKVGVMATNGTVQSGSYLIEIEKFFPQLDVEQEACPMWVPLVENGEYDHPGADYFIRQHVNRLLGRSPEIDTILLACTHYPLLSQKIRACLPDKVKLISQGPLVAASLEEYLARHPEMDQRLTRGASRNFFTTDDTTAFNQQARVFLGEPIQSQRADLV